MGDFCTDQPFNSGAPGPIGNITPNTGTFTVLTATVSVAAPVGAIAALTDTTILTNHLSGNSSIPTIAVDAGAGTGASATLTTGSTDLAGVINVITGATPVAASLFATITFSTAFLNAPFVVVTPANGTAASQSGAVALYANAGSTTTTAFSVSCGSSAPAAGTYQFAYIVIGQKGG